LLFVNAQYIYHYLSLWLASKIVDVVLFPALVISRVGTHIINMLLFGSGACQQSVLERADCEHCEKPCSAPAGRSLRRTVRFGSRSPRGSLCCRGAEMTRSSGFADETAGVGTGSALSQLSRASSSNFQF